MGWASPSFELAREGEGLDVRAAQGHSITSLDDEQMLVRLSALDRDLRGPTEGQAQAAKAGGPKI